MLPSLPREGRCEEYGVCTIDRRLLSPLPTARSEEQLTRGIGSSFWRSGSDYERFNRNNFNVCY